MKFIFPLIIAVSSLMGHDSYVDLQFTADPYDLRGQTHLDVCAPHVFYHTNGSLIFTPEVTTYVNSNTDIGFSIAKKHEFNGKTVGAHFFYDRSSLPNYSFNQVGIGLHYAAENFELTANYYRPLSEGAIIPGTELEFPTLIKPCKWVDSEILLKTSKFHIGTGPSYNLDFKEMGLHTRIVIPTNTCEFSLGGLLGSSGFTEAFFSISFSLMKNPSSSSLSRPITRTKKCSVSTFNLPIHDDINFDRYSKQIENLITLPKGTKVTHKGI